MKGDAPIADRVRAVIDEYGDAVANVPDAIQPRAGLVAVDVANVLVDQDVAAGHYPEGSFAMEANHDLYEQLAQSMLEDREQERASDLAPSDVVIGLSFAEALTVEEALSFLAGIDEGENTDYDELVRLSDFFRERRAAAQIPGNAEMLRERGHDRAADALEGE